MRAALLLLPFLTAAALAAEEMLPIQPPVTRYTSVWDESPFNRVVVRAVKNQIVSTFARNLILEGIVTDADEGLSAYVRDRTDGSYSVVTERASESQPLFIVASSNLDDPSKAAVTITDGKERAEIQYETEALTRTIVQDAPEMSDPIASTDQPPSSVNAANNAASPAENTSARPDDGAPRSGKAKGKGNNPGGERPARRRILLPGQ